MGAEGAGVPTAFSCNMASPSGSAKTRHPVQAAAMSVRPVASHRASPAAAKMLRAKMPGSTPRPAQIVVGDGAGEEPDDTETRGREEGES